MEKEITITIKLTEETVTKNINSNGTFNIIEILAIRELFKEAYNELIEDFKREEVK